MPGVEVNREAALQPGAAAMCTIAKWEGKYMEEWIDYYRSIGFRNIYILDNDASDWTVKNPNPQQEYKNARQKYCPCSGVHVLPFPLQSSTKQMYGNEVCVHMIRQQNALWERWGKKTGTKAPRIKWVAMFDVDEFLVIKIHSNVVELLEDYLPDDPASTAGQLSLNWLMFGTSNRTGYEPLPVTYRFQHHNGYSAHVKSIVRVDDYVRSPDPHRAALKEGKNQIDTNRRPFDGFMNPNGPLDVAVIHHYQTKSLEEWRVKTCKRGNVIYAAKTKQRPRAGKFSHCNSTKAYVGTVHDDIAQGVHRYPTYPLETNACGSPDAHWLGQNSASDNGNAAASCKKPGVEVNREAALQPGAAAMCTIAKWEGKYIEEWIDYYRSIGFRNIYILDNDASDWTDKNPNPQQEYKNARKKYCSCSGVHVLPFPLQSSTKQMYGYKVCVHLIRQQNALWERWGKKTGTKAPRIKWVAMFDVDEFLVIKNHSNVVELLEDYLPDDPASTAGQLSLIWLMFGTSNRTGYEPLPVTYRFQHHNGYSAHVKSIVRVDDYVRSPDPHRAALKEGKNQIDTNRRPFDGFMNPNGPLDVAVIHHYQTKSLEEWRVKTCKRGRAIYAAKAEQFSKLGKFSRCNSTKAYVGTVHDDSAWKRLQNITKYGDIGQ
eukprot:gene15833-21958_t